MEGIVGGVPEFIQICRCRCDWQIGEVKPVVLKGLDLGVRLFAPQHF